MQPRTQPRIWNVLVEVLLEAFMEYRPPGPARWLSAAWIALLFLAGSVGWTYFLNRGVIDFSRHDWAEVTAHRYAFLQDAVSTGALPLHMPGAWALRNVTDRFVSVADTNLSPHVYLLRFVELGQFFLINTLLLYAAGFLGLLLLRRRFQLSAFAFSLLLVLLFFGGSIAVHISVGHANWASYFLVPYFVYLIFEGIDGPRHPWRWVLYLSIYLLAIVTQGAFHLFVASVFLCGLVALAYPGRAGLFLRGMVFSLLLSAIRLLPPVLNTADFDTAFLSGFTTVGELLESLVRLVPPRPDLVSASSRIGPLGWWELDYFVGVLGLVYIVIFGTYWWTRGKPPTMAYRRLLLPVAVMTAFTVGRMFNLLHLLQVPLLSSQRVSSRMFYLPLTVVVVLATVGLQQFVEKRKANGAVAIALTAGAVVLCWDLWQHFALWRVANMKDLFESTPIDLSLDVVANHTDWPYFLMLGLGLVISLGTGLVLAYLVWKERVRRVAGGG